MQEDKIKQYCALNDYNLVEVIADRGISAKNISGRPGLKRALDMIMSGQADGLVAWKLDRMFRSTVDALQTAEQFKSQDKCLISITEKLDTCSAMGEFFFSLMVSLAQMERKLTGERTKAILQGKKSRGEFIGKPKYGYASAGKTLQCNSVEQTVIAMVKEMSEQGLSCRSIAESLNARHILTKQAKSWTHKQISRLLAA
jgi:site-specific DNA recombinase